MIAICIGGGDKSHQHNFKQMKSHTEEHVLWDWVYTNFKNMIVSGYINHEDVVTSVGEGVRVGKG